MVNIRNGSKKDAVFYNDNDFSRGKNVVFQNKITNFQNDFAKNTKNCKGCFEKLDKCFEKCYKLAHLNRTLKPPNRTQTMLNRTLTGLTGASIRQCKRA